MSQSMPIMLQFQAVKYKHKNSPLVLQTDTLPVDASNGAYTLPSQDVVLVKIHCAALNPVDWLVKNSQHYPLFRGDKGFGMDYSGEVAAIGTEAAAKSKLAVGDRVSGLIQVLTGPGTLSEYLLVNPSDKTGVSLRKSPANLSWQEAAAYPLVGGTAQTMFDTVKEGNSFKKVLVLGAGTAVGRYVVQLAKNVYNAEEIVVTCSGRTEPVAMDLGATKVIDYTKQKSILNPVLDSVKETGKFDVILDCCGGNDLFPEITQIIQPKEKFGHYVSIVGDHKSDFVNSTMFSMLLGNLSVAGRVLKGAAGFLPYYYSQAMVSVTGRWADSLPKYLEEGKVKVFVDSVYPLEKFADALARLQSNQAQGKVIVNVIEEQQT